MSEGGALGFKTLGEGRAPVPLCPRPCGESGRITEVSTVSASKQVQAEPASSWSGVDDLRAAGEGAQKTPCSLLIPRGHAVQLSQRTLQF